MPAKSQAQRAYLNMKFGHKWVKQHHYDNAGKLPGHVKKGKKMKQSTTGESSGNERHEGHAGPKHTGKVVHGDMTSIIGAHPGHDKDAHPSHKDENKKNGMGRGCCGDGECD